MAKPTGKKADSVNWVESEVPIGKLKPYERNPRKISNDAFSRLVENIKKNGYHQRMTYRTHHMAIMPF